jgi:murein L,D-transpeptidase YcbB/YkuD
MVLILVACQQPTREKNLHANGPADTATAPQIELHFDESGLQKIIESQRYPDTIAERLKSFYQGRNYQYAWFTNEGLAEQATNFWNAQSNYISYTRDSGLFNAPLQQIMDTLDTGLKIDSSQLLNTEIGLSVQFFRYARRAYQGKIRLGEHDLDWYIPRKRIDVTSLLDSLISNKGKNLDSYEPVNAQYRLLKEKLLSYYKLSENGKWQTINLPAKKLNVGDSTGVIVTIKKKLMELGDLESSDSTPIFDEQLINAIKNFQLRYGLNADGVIGGATLRYLNDSLQMRIKQILVNMERMRWIPVEPKGDFILVNIPQFRLIAYENGKRAFAMNIVAGSSQHQTVIFTGDLKYVVFSPYWNVPPSIIQNEIIPGMKRDPRYLAKHNMEWNKGAVRQKPGRNNSLGRVKFLFPNNYNIYLHDTPAKSLFNEEKRAFSHGCIRLAEPKKLAIWLLRNQPVWTSEKIGHAMNAGKEKFVTLTSTVPVFLGYFTAWVDENGKLNFRDDIYGHDKKLADRIFAE